MATSGTYATSHIKAGSRTWYWEFYFDTSYSGNTATVSWSVHTRCETGSSGSSYVGNYGFSGSVNGTALSKSGNFIKDEQIGSGTFTKTGGQSFYVTITAHPYSSGYTSGGEWTITLDTKVTTPTVTCSTTQGLNTIGASLVVTNNGGASIVSQGINLYSNSTCTTQVSSITGTSGTFTGLTPNTTYYARAYANNGTYTGYSTVQTVSTYNKATISTASDFNHGDTLTVTYANPSSSTLAIGIYKGDTPIASDRTCTGTSYTFTFTDTELDDLYKQYGNNSTQTVRVILKTANTYTDYKDLTVTLTGNQKTIRDKVNGEWKRGIIYIKVSGAWKKGVIWQKVSGTWKRGI